MGIKEISFNAHDEWLAIRSKYIGGSDASACIGMNPYKSRYTLWAEKTGKVEAFAGNITTMVGACLEDFVAKMFEEQTGKKVRRKNFTMVNDLYPYACANIDRAVVGEKAFLECKTTNNPVILRQLKDNDFPEAYYCQCVHYLAVTGLEKCYLAVLSECKNFKVYELERDEAEIKALMDAERDFWNLVETKTEPAVDGTDSTSDTIKKLYPNTEDRSIDLFGYADCIQQICSYSKQIKELEALKDEYANKVKLYMKEAGTGILDGYNITFRTQNRKTFDEAKFAKEHPDINVNDYFNVSSYRVFKAQEKKR